MSPRLGIPIFSHSDEGVDAMVCRHCLKLLRNRKWMIVLFPLEQTFEAGHVRCEKAFHAEELKRAKEAADREFKL